MEAKMNAGKTFAALMKKFDKAIRKFCEIDKQQQIILHINNFIPSPNQVLGDLFDCFSVGDELIVGYAFQVTWG